MAKIVFLTYSQASWVFPVHPDGYVQGFANALARMGNTVKIVLLHDLQQTEVVNAVVSFNPDIIISLNNDGIDSQLLEKTDCPIVLNAVDSLPFLKELDLVKKYRDRYYFLHPSEDSYNQIAEVFPGTPENRNVILGHVTDLRKKDIEQDIPVSFVGSLGNWNLSFTRYWGTLFQTSDLADPQTLDFLIERKEAFLKQLREYESSPLDVQSTILKAPALPDFDAIAGFPYEKSIMYLRTCNLRYAVLEQLTDLGLKIYSYPNGMVDVIQYNIKIFECFDFIPSVTLADSERTFNRSKISMNLPNAQAVKGCSWRVPDILASNACLLSDYRPDLKKLMTGYIDMPMYQSPAEARELAQKLLKDEVWRKEIVAASQQMVEDKCRFEHRLRKVAEKTGLKLDDPDGKGSIELKRKEEKESSKALCIRDDKVFIVEKKAVSSVTENIIRIIFKTILFLVPSKKKRKYLRKRFSLGKSRF